VSFVGNVAAVQATDLGGNTRIFYQNADNSIQLSATTGPFSVGTFRGTTVLVPANEALCGTPIAATMLKGNAFQEVNTNSSLCSSRAAHWKSQMHIFFVSPNNILSEYIWENAAGSYRGGPSCGDCITVNNFVVEPGSQVLYVMGNIAAGSPALLRVGFVSADAPGTLTEAEYTAAKGWQLAELP
jgi:hypothetical protein